jgi:hypothetical protein
MSRISFYIRLWMARLRRWFAFRLEVILSKSISNSRCYGMNPLCVLRSRSSPSSLHRRVGRRTGRRVGRRTGRRTGELAGELAGWQWVSRLAGLSRRASHRSGSMLQTPFRTMVILSPHLSFLLHSNLFGS